MKDGKLYGLAIADIHFGKKDDMKLYEELKKHFIPKIEKEKSDIDYIVIAGDLFDRVLRMNEIGSSLCIKFILELVDMAEKYDFKLRILKGTKTHDYNQLNNFKSIEANHYPRVRIIQEAEQEEIFPDIFYLYIPEEYMEKPAEYYKEFFELEEGVKYDMGFFHGTFDYVGYIPNVESERHIKNAPVFEAKKMAELVYGKWIGGHIHERTVYKNKIEYTSSFSRFAFGENKSKGFLEVFYDTETLECTTNFIENTDAPVYLTIDMDEIQGISLEEKMSVISDLKKEYDNLRIVAKNVNDQDVSAMKSLVANDIDVKLDIRRKDIEETVDEEYMFIINREYDLPTTVQKYILLDMEANVSLEDIKKALEPEKKKA
jgi:DNA repair exonuclease SbcCD nuclease subunit